MATVREDSIPHIVRTAHEQRLAGIWNATISRIDQVNHKIRLIRLGLLGNPPARSHLPGQYIDLYVPDITSVGGFTITSPPSTTRLPSDPYIELAIQNSPNNPPAAYLWQHTETILHKPVSFRIGGNFIYPPATLSQEECSQIDRSVFIAGGVGINPIMSMLSALDGLGPSRVGGLPRRTNVLYTSRRTNSPGTTDKPEEILFEKRLLTLAEKWRGSEVVDYRFTQFETTENASVNDEGNVQFVDRRISHEDLFEALGPEGDRERTVVYVCGLPAMTDEFVEVLKNAKGMDERRVLVEKWW